MTTNTKGFTFKEILIIVAFMIGIYYLPQVSSDWINRIGIILNFVAGFMLAPELLGEVRLKKVESYMEEISHAIGAQIDKRFKTPDFIEDESDRYKITILFISFGQFFLYYALIFYFDQFFTGNVLEPIKNLLSDNSLLSLLVFFLTPGYLVSIPASFATTIIAARRILIEIFYLIKELIYRIIQLISKKSTFNAEGASIAKRLKTILFAFPNSLIYFHIRTIYIIINYITAYITAALSGEYRIRSILVSFGIFFFILGNALQFIASFQ